MKERIRNWLGLTEMHDRQISIVMRLQKIHDMVEEKNRNVEVYNRAIGHLLARIEPMLGIPEDDPTRRAASDKLGDQIITRLYGEVLASEKHR